jgi:nucleotide-binding universal stress UspA family protein
MITIRRILCPLDFSRFSRHALEQAVELAREFGGEIAALHVAAVEPVTDVVTVGAPIPLEPARLQPSQRVPLLAGLRDFTYEVEAEGVSIRTILNEGRPVDAIVDYASTWPADLIVMGTHGRSGFERIVLGSVAERVLRKAPCPVLTVPPRMVTAKHGLTFSRIVCAVDFSSASLRGLDYAASLAAFEGPGVQVVNVIELFGGEVPSRDTSVFDTPDFRAGLIKTARERLHEAVPAAARDRTTITETVVMGKPYKEILRIAEEERADLIVLGVQGRSATDLLFFGSTTQHVVRQAACPVLTIRA